MRLKLLGFAILGWQFSAYVSVKNVIVNVPAEGSFAAYYRFFESAFLNTEFMTYIVGLGIFVLGMWVVRDMLSSRKFLYGKKAFVRI